MTREEHIGYWISTADKDWDIALKLFHSGDYVYCMFFTHLVMEKIAKALWIINNEDVTPPRSHNIVYLLEKSNIPLSTEQKDFLLILNDFQLEGRYPDYKQKIFQVCTKQFTDDLLTDAKKIRTWMLSQIL